MCAIEVFSRVFINTSLSRHAQLKVQPPTHPQAHQQRTEAGSAPAGVLALTLEQTWMVSFFFHTESSFFLLSFVMNNLLFPCFSMINVACPTPTHREINLAQVPLLFRQVAAAVASLKTGVIMTSNGRRKVRAKNIFFNISYLFRGGVSKQKNSTSEVPLLVQENNGVQRAPKALARAYA